MWFPTGSIDQIHLYRPLGSVSDFVVAKLPALLARVRNHVISADELTQRCAVELDAVSVPSLLKRCYGRHGHEIALLDLLFMESGIVHSGGRPGALLQSMVDDLAKSLKRIPAMTYADLVMINPAEDMRVFCNGDIKASEKMFYRNQISAELHLCHAARFCQTAIGKLSKGSGRWGLWRAYRILKAAARETCQMANDVTAMNAELPVEHFAVIRQYFAAHPIRGFKGPSGVFSVGIFLLELLLNGRRLGENHPDYLRYYLEENTQYLPQEGVQEIHDAYQQALDGKTVFALLDRPSSNGVDSHAVAKCKSAAIDIGLAIRLFRGNHYKAVKHQIPDVLEGYAAGTGEADAGDLLTERMKIRYE